MIKSSGINYMGNKTKLIKKGLCDMFPKDIDTFYDLFGGSGVVSMNTTANQYVLNDIDVNTYNIYRGFKNISNVEELNTDIITVIEKYQLPLHSTDMRKKGMTIEQNNIYKQRYHKLRDDFNEDKDFLKLLVLQRYSMSNTIRFNSEGFFNMPKGNGYYQEKKHSIYQKNTYNFLKQDNVRVENEDYYSFNDFGDRDLVYLDPPYINSTATYNESGRWSQEDEERLFSYILKLLEKDVKFILSNTFFNKGVENKGLKKFVSDNNLYYFIFDDFSYCSFGQGNSLTQEVIISNFPLDKK